LESITVVLLLLVAVIVSGIVSRIVPLPIPRPLFQIALGAFPFVIVHEAEHVAAGPLDAVAFTCPCHCPPP